MNMREITLSKEVYDRTPSKFFAFFIYGLLILLVTALVWAYFGRLDIVIRAHGIIRPHSQVAIVISPTGGEVLNVNFYEGQVVARGDVLYTIDTFHLENDRQILAEQLELLNFELTSLELFLESIEAGENLINSFNAEFSAQFDNFLINIGAIQHGASNRINALQSEEGGLEETLAHALFELEVLRLFENSITSGTDLFNSTQASVGRNRETQNTYRNQYLRYVVEMDSLNFQLEDTQTSLHGYRMIRNYIINNVTLFPEEAEPSKWAELISLLPVATAEPMYTFNDIPSRYQGILEEHLLQHEQLMENYTQATDNHRSISALYEAGLVPYVDLQTATNRLNSARTAITEFSASFLMTADNRILAAENNITQIENQIELLRITTLAGISNQMFVLEDAIVNMKHALEQTRLQQNALFFVDDEAGDVAVLRLGEISRLKGRISLMEQEIARLYLSLTGIDAQINDSIVRAPIDGEVAVNMELSEGGFIMSGIQVLTIIPTRGDKLNANLFISNNDIGQISEGLLVRYDIAALPRRDFGEITGIVTRISTDITTAEGAMGYFIVESDIADRVYYDTRGNVASLRVGMAFEARIIVDQQRILFYLLDRLNLLIS